MKKILLTLLILAIGVTPAYSGQWRNEIGANTIPGDTTVSDIDFVSFDDIVEPLDRLLSKFNQDMNVQWSSTSQIIVPAGQVMVSNTAGTIRLMMSTSSNTTVTFANIDTGAEASSTTYYVYAIAATSAAETATFKISTNSTTPSGETFYAKIGSFFNDNGSDIDREKIFTNAYGATTNDSNGAPEITAVYDYGTSSSSFTVKESSMKFAYGRVSVSGNSTVSITNLPFTSSSTYSCWTTFQASVSFDDGYAGCIPSSGTALTISNQQASTRTMNWGAFGH